MEPKQEWTLCNTSWDLRHLADDNVEERGGIKKADACSRKGSIHEPTKLVFLPPLRPEPTSSDSEVPKLPSWQQNSVFEMNEENVKTEA